MAARQSISSNLGRISAASQYSMHVPPDTVAPWRWRLGRTMGHTARPGPMGASGIGCRQLWRAGRPGRAATGIEQMGQRASHRYALHNHSDDLTSCSDAQHATRPPGRLASRLAG